MPLFTPRGLKIRLPLPYAFALLTRLHPKVAAFKVLQTVEALQNLPALLSFIATIVAFVLKRSPTEIGVITFCSYSLGVLMNHLGFFAIPCLLRWSRLYGNFSGYGLLVILLLIVGYLFVGAYGLLGFLGGRTLGILPRSLLNMYRGRKILNAIGVPLTESEQHFFNAYRLHAQTIGASLDLRTSQEEECEEHWKPSLERLAIDWPEVVARFTLDK